MEEGGRHTRHGRAQSTIAQSTTTSVSEEGVRSSRRRRTQLDTAPVTEEEEGNRFRRGRAQTTTASVANEEGSEDGSNVTPVAIEAGGGALVVSILPLHTLP